MRVARALILTSLAAACSSASFSAGRSHEDGGATGGAAGSVTAGSGGARSGGAPSAGGAPTGSGGAGSGGRAAGGAAVTSGGSSGTSGAHGTGAVGGGAATDGSVGSGDATVVQSSCPPTPPDATSPCSDGLLCSYGTDLRISCRASFECKGGSWLATYARCVPTPACTNESPPAVVGTACSVVGHFCQYSDQLTCGCIPCPDANCPAPNVWNCAPPPPSPCPPVAPNVGQPCDPASGLSCKYAFCPIEPYVVASCQGGVWSWDSTCNGP